MNFRCCARESELSDALKAGYWPDACDASLREHVNACERCGDFVLLTQVFKGSRAEAVDRAELDHPGLLWWRAQLRRRNQALEQLSRPTYLVERFAFLSVLLAAVVFVIWECRHVTGWLDWINGVPHYSSFRVEALWSASSNWSLLLLMTCLGALVLFTAVALYLSSDQ